MRRREVLEVALGPRTRLQAAAVLDRLGVEALAGLAARGVPEAGIRLRYSLALRAGGPEAPAVTVAFGDEAAMRAALCAACGQVPDGQAVVIAAAEVEAAIA